MWSTHVSFSFSSFFACKGDHRKEMASIIPPLLNWMSLSLLLGKVGMGWTSPPSLFAPTSNTLPSFVVKRNLSIKVLLTDKTSPPIKYSFGYRKTNSFSLTSWYSQVSSLPWIALHTIFPNLEMVKTCKPMTQLFPPLSPVHPRIPPRVWSLGNNHRVGSPLSPPYVLVAVVDIVKALLVWLFNKRSPEKDPNQEVFFF